MTSGSTPEVAAWVDGAEAQREFGLELSSEQWRQLLEPPLPHSAVLLDLKGMVPRELGALRL